MQLTFLGTSAGVPTKTRNVSALALRLPQRAEVWLFDCGEATQHRLQHTDLKISQISRIFISHLHGDHLFGLMGLLATCGMAGQAQQIDIYGPAGLRDYVQLSARHTRMALGDQVRVHTVAAGVIHEDSEFVVRCAPLEHRVPAFGYRIEERERPGRFRVEAAAALGIPSGPLYGRLKRGERVELPDGRVFDGAALSDPPAPGRVVAYCTDTVPCANAITLGSEADVLIHEATFAAPEAALARQSTHSTATDAARIASSARARQLVLTHISPRYAYGNPITAEDLLAEARAVFPATMLAHDFLTLDVPRRARPETNTNGGDVDLNHTT